MKKIAVRALAALVLTATSAFATTVLPGSTASHGTSTSTPAAYDPCLGC